MSKPLTPTEAAELKRLTRRAFGLLAVMTLACFGGPVAIGVALRGGVSPEWPPDRPVEWATLIGVSAAVVALMILAVALALANQRASQRKRNS